MPDTQPFAGLAQNEDVTGLLQELAFRLSEIADSVGSLTPDAVGRLRVVAEAVGTIVNQSSIGGLAANQHILALTQMNEFCLRQNIVISA